MSPGVVLVLSSALAAAAGGAPEEEDALPPARDLFGSREAGDARDAGRPGDDEGGDRADDGDGHEDDGSVRGTITLSDGRREEGKLSLTLDHSLTFFDAQAQEWREVALEELARLDARPRAEEIDREWRWKEAGRDEKVYTGRTRPRRWLDHDVTLADGSRFSGHVKGTVIFVEMEVEAEVEAEEAKPPERDDPGKRSEASLVPGGKNTPGGKDARPARKAKEARKTTKVRKRHFLRQYDRGDWGDTLESLVYVKSVVIRSPDGKAEPEGGADAGEVRGERPGE